MSIRLGHRACIIRHSNDATPERYGDVYGLEVIVVATPVDRTCRHCGRAKASPKHYGVLMPDGKCFSVLPEYLAEINPCTA